MKNLHAWVVWREWSKLHNCRQSLSNSERRTSRSEYAAGSNWYFRVSLWFHHTQGTKRHGRTELSACPTACLWSTPTTAWSEVQSVCYWLSWRVKPHLGRVTLSSLLLVSLRYRREATWSTTLPLASSISPSMSWFWRSSRQLCFKPV